MVAPREFGLIGRHISHSFSAGYFADKFVKEGIDAVYHSFDLDSIDDLPRIIAERENLVGLNVTSPYKREVIPFLDSMSEEARELEAVNVISIRRDADGTPVLTGHNTDAEGFRTTLSSLDLPEDVKALILGTGGAASAVEYALRKERIPSLTVSRNPKGEMISYAEAENLLESHRLIINATPLGMWPDTDGIPLLDLRNITSGNILYDLIYNPPLTRFLQEGEKRGAKVMNGLRMLINQAELSWNIWNGKE